MDNVGPKAILGPLLEKAVDFTNIEDVCLAVWLEAVLRNQFVVARAILRSGLLAEHYRSLLPNDLADATEDQRETLERLHARFRADLADFQGPRPAPGEPEPLHPGNILI